MLCAGDITQYCIIHQVRINVFGARRLRKLGAPNPHKFHYTNFILSALPSEKVDRSPISLLLNLGLSTASTRERKCNGYYTG